MRSIFRFRREWVLVLVLIAIAAIMSRMSPLFLSADNLLKQSRYLAEAGIIACGMTLAIMTGGIDLSVGSILALCSIVIGYVFKAFGMEAAIAAALMVGILCGAFNGLLVTRWKLPPLVITLATMALFRGIAMVISKGRPVSYFPKWFEFFGQGGIPIGNGNIVPNSLIIWIVLVLIAIVIAHQMPFGRYATAIGDNERAAKFSALPVDRVKFLIYTTTGLLCAVAAIVYTSRVNTAKADAAVGLELDVIVAVVLGGTAITGGRGTIIGSFLGLFILGWLRNGLSLAGVKSVWIEVIAGVLLIATAIANQRLLERAARRTTREPGKTPVAPPAEKVAA